MEKFRILLRKKLGIQTKTIVRSYNCIFHKCTVHEDQEFGFGFLIFPLSGSVCYKFQGSGSVPNPGSLTTSAHFSFLLINP